MARKSVPTKQSRAKVRKELEKKAGHPLYLTPEVFERVIEGISQGKNNRRACEEAGIAPETLYSNLAKRPEYMLKYREAKTAAVESLAEKALEVNEAALTAETGAQVQAHKHLADGLRWHAARLAPQRWGERAEVTVTARVDLRDTEELAKRLAFLEALNARSRDAEDVEYVEDVGPE